LGTPSPADKRDRRGSTVRVSKTDVQGIDLGDEASGRLRASFTSARVPGEKPVTSVHSKSTRNHAPSSRVG
jgi:hypothetical protein